MGLISQYSTTQGPCEMLSRRVMSWSKEMKLNPVFNLQMFGRLNKSVSLECHFCTSSIRSPVIHQRDVKHLKVSASKCNSQNVTAKPDPIYRNRLVNMLVNRILKHGKKSLAYQIIYRALKRIQQKTETNPLLVLRQAIREVTPEITVKARRVGGSTHQIPVEIRSTQGKTLAIRWLLGASRKRLGRNMVFKLSSELVDAANGSGAAIRKKEETHKMAEANRAFAHFR